MEQKQGLIVVAAHVLTAALMEELAAATATVSRENVI
jgi:hypothetical protein